MGTTYPQPMQTCGICSHYRGTTILDHGPAIEGDHVHICDAFRSGIPDQILTGKHIHSRPYPGDNGIIFEPVHQKTI